MVKYLGRERCLGHGASDRSCQLNCATGGVEARRNTTAEVAADWRRETSKERICVEKVGGGYDRASKKRRGRKSSCGNSARSDVGGSRKEEAAAGTRFI